MVSLPVNMDHTHGSSARLFVAGAVVVAVWLVARWDAKRRSRKPELVFCRTDFNKAVLSRCPALQQVYHSTPLLTNGHLETILAAKLRISPGVAYRREIIITKCGGAIALDWEHVEDSKDTLPDDAPIIILLPGLTGGSTDSYVQHAVQAARAAGVRAVVFNSRGTANSPVLTPQFYSASFTEDTREVVSHVRQQHPDCILFAAGWSLGANILINYLAEEGDCTPIEAAVSLGNPFDLVISNDNIRKGINWIYDINLTNRMRHIVCKHEMVWRSWHGPGREKVAERVKRVKSIREFDEAVTIHSFGWSDVNAYYSGSSSSQRIPEVAIPLLCIQAINDPISPAAAIPAAAIAANPNCLLAITPTGGHLGWTAAPGSLLGEPWTTRPMFEWLASVHLELLRKGIVTPSSSVCASPRVPTPSPRVGSMGVGRRQQLLQVQQWQQQLVALPHSPAITTHLRVRVQGSQQQQQQLLAQKSEQRLVQLQQDHQQQQQQVLKLEQVGLPIRAMPAFEDPFTKVFFPVPQSTAAAAALATSGGASPQAAATPPAKAATPAAAVASAAADQDSGASSEPETGTVEGNTAAAAAAVTSSVGLSSQLSIVRSVSQSRAAADAAAAAASPVGSGVSSLVARAVMQYQQQLTRDASSDNLAADAELPKRQQQQQQQRGEQLLVNREQQQQQQGTARGTQATVCPPQSRKGQAAASVYGHEQQQQQQQQQQQGTDIPWHNEHSATTAPATAASAVDSPNAAAAAAAVAGSPAVVDAEQQQKPELTAALVVNGSSRTQQAGLALENTEALRWAF